MTPTYSFGDPNDPRADDLRFDTEDAAISAALTWCEEHDDLLHTHILAVWSETNGSAETVCLIYAGEVWRS